MAVLRVFSRPGCHLCEQLVVVLLPLVRGRLAVEVVNIDEDDQLRQEYGRRIPVLEYAGRFVCQYTLDNGALQGILDSLPE